MEAIENKGADLQDFRRRCNSCCESGEDGRVFFKTECTRGAKIAAGEDWRRWGREFTINAITYFIFCQVPLRY